MSKVVVLPSRGLNVVVTGGTKGLGRSLVKQFVKTPLIHKVIFTSRSEEHILSLIRELDSVKTTGLIADACSLDSSAKIQDSVGRHFDGIIDVWINNAACSEGNSPFISLPPQNINTIVSTNVTGSLIGTQTALNLMKQNKEKAIGHIFNVIGAGSDGGATPGYSVYGCTKAALMQFTKSLQSELLGQNAFAKMHVISPGMMPTDVLGQNNFTPLQKAVFNIICEDPDVVAEDLAPRIIKTVIENKNSEYIRFLTITKLFQRLLSISKRRGRFYEE